MGGQGEGQEEAAASDGGARRGSEDNQRSVSERFWAFLHTWTVGSMASVVAFSTRALGGGNSAETNRQPATCSTLVRRTRRSALALPSSAAGAQCAAQRRVWAKGVGGVRGPGYGGS